MLCRDKKEDIKKMLTVINVDFFTKNDKSALMNIRVIILVLTSVIKTDLLHHKVDVLLLEIITYTLCSISHQGK